MEAEEVAATEAEVEAAARREGATADKFLVAAGWSGSGGGCDGGGGAAVRRAAAKAGDGTRQFVDAAADGSARE